MESLIGEADVSSLETRVPFRKGHNFGSYSWITLKILEEFLNAVYLGFDVESLIGDANVSLLETRVPVRNAITFDPTVGSRLKF